MMTRWTLRIDEEENDDEKNPDNSNSNLDDSGRKSESSNNNKDSGRKSDSSDRKSDDEPVEKVQCPYKKCNNQSASKEQLPCASEKCSKKTHVSCFHHYLSTSKFNFKVWDDFFCCATKACCSEFWVGSQGPTTGWDLDGTDGPNTAPNSETVLLDWLTTGENWSLNHGGKGSNSKTGVTKKKNRCGRC